MADIKAKLGKIQAVIDHPETHPNIRENAQAAMAKLTAAHATQQVVRAKVLVEHQRRAWMCLVNGAGILSKRENSFLHNVRERRVITEPMARWLNDLETRIKWEKSL